MCCHVFLPACVFPSGLGNTPVTEIEGSPFPHGGVILNVSGLTRGSVVCDPTACDDDASTIGICSSASTDILASLRKKPPLLMAGGNAWLFFLFWLDQPEVGSESEPKKLYGSSQVIGVLLSCVCRRARSCWSSVSLASSSVILKLACTNFSSAFQQ